MIMSDELFDLLGTETLEVFDVAKSLAAASGPGFCQAQVIRDWMTKDRGLSQSHFEYCMSQVRNDYLESSIVIASISEDFNVIEDCVLALFGNEHLLVYFFSSLVACSPQIGLNSLKRYVQTDPAKSNKHLLVVEGPSFKHRVGHRVLLSIAPFVPCSQLLISVVVAAFPEPESNSEELICEVILAVLERLTRKEQLGVLLEKCCQQFQLFPPKSIILAISALVKNSIEIPDAVLPLLFNTWIALLATGEVPNDAEFERLVFQTGQKSKTLLPYLKLLEAALLSKPTTVALYHSLNRIFSLKVMDVSDVRLFLLVFVSGCLVPTKEISDFCVAGLHSLFRFDTKLEIAQADSFSFEHISGVTPFFTDLARNFSGSAILSLLTSLLSHLSVCPPESKHSIVVFVMFVVARDPRAILKAQAKFSAQIATVCPTIDPNDDGLSQWIAQILNLLATPDPALFYEQLQSIPTSDFLRNYLSRFLRSPLFADAVGTALVQEILNLRSFNGKSRAELAQIPRIVADFSLYVKVVVKEGMPAEKLGKAILAFVVLFSSLNLMRIAGNSPPAKEFFGDAVRFFCRNMTATLSNSVELDRSDKASANQAFFYKELSKFMAVLPLLPHPVIDGVVAHCHELEKTPHLPTVFIVTGILAGYFANVATESGFKLRERIFLLFFDLGKHGTEIGGAVSYALRGTRTAFSYENLVHFIPANLATLSNLCILDIQTLKSSIGILSILLNIARVADRAFLAANAARFHSAVGAAVSSKLAELGSVLVLNILGEIAKKLPDPSDFLKDSAVSFAALAPLLLSDNPEIQQRVSGIFQVVIIGRPTLSDLELVFPALMSLYFAAHGNSSGYNKLAASLLSDIAKSPAVKKEWIELLGQVMEPIRLIGDSVALLPFLQLLKKLSKDENREITLLAVATMARFSVPKPGE
jgi:hypothetical protein